MHRMYRYGDALLAEGQGWCVLAESCTAARPRCNSSGLWIFWNPDLDVVFPHFVLLSRSGPLLPHLGGAEAVGEKAPAEFSYVQGARGMGAGVQAPSWVLADDLGRLWEALRVRLSKQIWFLTDPSNCWDALGLGAGWICSANSCLQLERGGVHKHNLAVLG